MLRKSFYTLLLSFMMSATAMADMKIGFVNVARLLEKAPQAEQAKKELEREFSGATRNWSQSRKKSRAWKTVQARILRRWVLTSVSVSSVIW